MQAREPVELAAGSRPEGQKVRMGAFRVGEALGGDGSGGPLLTKTLLVSGLTAGGSNDGPRLVARDKASGEIVGSADLPASPIGTPMTYMHEGKQYIALTIGGDIPELVALTLA